MRARFAVERADEARAVDCVGVFSNRLDSRVVGYAVYHRSSERDGAVPRRLQNPVAVTVFFRSRIFRDGQPFDGGASITLCKQLLKGRQVVN